MINKIIYNIYYIEDNKRYIVYILQYVIDII